MEEEVVKSRKCEMWKEKKFSAVNFAIFCLFEINYFFAWWETLTLP